MDISNAQRDCNSAARPYQLTKQQTAVIAIGRLLVPYRVNCRPEQRAELMGMARMALALGAIDAATHAHLLELLSPDYTPTTTSPTQDMAPRQEVH
ncbi:hypothetical protein [Halomonas sp. HG01]|uniref:hypothetical protein n=1 Tax=Halomonas sp. HG01 TaxID=1609967 RepID=UPI0006144E5B|nr:hypothetical protein [Halomonas sp. HG01]